jgi:hypothetical protein
MATTIQFSTRLSEKVSWTKVFLFCGILSSFLYIAMNVFVAMQWEGYNSFSQTVSELSAIGAPTRPLWVLLGIVYTLLAAIFGLGVCRSAGQNRNLKIVGILITTYGVIGIGWPLAPMHLREVLAAGGSTLSDTMHIVFAMVSVVLMLLAIGFGAVAFEKRFRLYSIVTIFILIVFGALTVPDAARIQANLPTPWVGVWERINIGAFLLWIMVLAVVLLRKQKLSGLN